MRDKQEIKKFFIDILYRTFLPNIAFELEREIKSKDIGEFEKRITVIKDTEMYKPDIKEIWEKKKGKKADTYQVFFDNVFICSINENDSKTEAELKFWQGFKEAYENYDIFVNKSSYEIYKAMQEANKKSENEKIELDKEIVKSHDLNDEEVSMVEEALDKVDDEISQNKSK